MKLLTISSFMKSTIVTVCRLKIILLTHSLIGYSFSTCFSMIRNFLKKSIKNTSSNLFLEEYKPLHET
jgi:ABC-type glycerol-3-phosphate transport system permease component